MKSGSGNASVSACEYCVRSCLGSVCVLYRKWQHVKETVQLGFISDVVEQISVKFGVPNITIGAVS
jgi:hypothetical protein